MGKKLVGIVLSLFACLAGQAQDSYTIAGNLPAIPDGKVLLVAPNQTGKMDTLNVTDCAQGKFTFKGTVAEPCIAYVYGGVGNEYMFILENAPISIKVENNNLSVTGGINQGLANDYIKLQNAMAQEHARVQQEVQKAAYQGDQMQIRALVGRYEKFMDDTRKQQEDIIRNNSASVASLFLTVITLQSADYWTLKERYELLSDPLKESFFGQRVAKRVALLSKIQVGSVAPDFTVKTPEGDDISLHSIAGKVKILDFWASWCQPCRQENPAMVEMYKKYHDEGLEIFSFSLDESKEDWLKAISEDSLPWKQGSDLKAGASEVVMMYDVKGIPLTILLDENNVIIAKGLRGEDLEARVAELLK